MSHPVTAIINLNTGNLFSIYSAVKRSSVGQKIIVTADPYIILNADRIILPGQGNSSKCLKTLNNKPELKEALFCALRLKPTLGICVGQHILCQSSEEGPTKCLNLLECSVKRLSNCFKVPNISWSSIFYWRSHFMLSGIPNAAKFYFAHSYCIGSDICYQKAITSYGGGLFASVLIRDNIFAVQFHPEKSSHYGLTVLSNFLKWKP